MSTPGRLGIGIIGMGHVGPVIGSALRAVGHQIVAVSASSDASRERADAMLPGVPIATPEEVVRRSEVVIVAVPDDQIGPLVSGLADLGAWQSGHIVIHLSGASGVGLLGAAAGAGAIPLAIHPAMTFTGTSVDVARLVGTPFAVTAAAPFLPIAQALVVEMGGEPVVVAEEDRPLYHAGLAHGANFIAGITVQTTRILAEAGIENPALYVRPLLEAALDRALTEGVAGISGPAARVDNVVVLLYELIDVARTGTPLTADAVERAVGLLETSTRPTEVLTDDILTSHGRTIRPKSLGQKAYTDAIEESTITFGIGPAGTGKTYLAMAKAVDALARKRVSRIILTRPAVEAGENLGFLPGSLTDKIDPYLRPLYDALHDMLEPEALPRLMAAGTIEVAPLAYMRGRTLNDAFVILDEAQNTSPEQMKMFLTRLGFGSRMVVTGDISQVDLPGGRESGLIVVRKILVGVDGISFCELGSADVVRHRLVGRIIEAYARHDAEVAAQDAASRPAGPPGRSGRNSQYRRGSSNRPARPYSERNPHDH